jgi:hypothetical protein
MKEKWIFFSGYRRERASQAERPTVAKVMELEKYLICEEE